MGPVKRSLFSCLYQYIHFLMILWVKCWGRPGMESWIRFAEKGLSGIRKAYGGSALLSFPRPDSLRTSCYDLVFPSPLIFAAFKDQLDVIEFWINLGMGGGCIKTILATPHEGNPYPRLQPVSINGQAHLINALGLPGKGVNGLQEALTARSFLQHQHVPIGISIGGRSVDEYIQVATEMNEWLKTQPSTQVYFEINISCPNIAKGKSLAQQVDVLDGLLKAIRAVTDRVIFVKVSPDESDAQLCKIAETLQLFPKMGINAGNTQYRTCTSLGLADQAISVGGGGLSGPSLFKRTYEVVQLLSNYQLPIIATGGISKIEDIIQLKEAGALLFGMATQLVMDPFCIPKLNQQLSQVKKNV